MNTNVEEATEGRLCTGEGCRDRQALKHVTATIRKIYHDLGQPLMVIHGYLELLELKKYGADVESMEQIMNAVSAQLGKIQELQGSLKDAAKFKALNQEKQETGEGK